MNEILTKALREALTESYAAELTNAPDIKHEFSADFTAEMNALIRRTDNKIQIYTRYIAAAAGLVLAVGAAVLIPMIARGGIPVAEPSQTSGPVTEAPPVTQRSDATSESVPDAVIITTETAQPALSVPTQTSVSESTSDTTAPPETADTTASVTPAPQTAESVTVSPLESGIPSVEIGTSAQVTESQSESSQASSVTEEQAPVTTAYTYDRKDIPPGVQLLGVQPEEPEEEIEEDIEEDIDEAAPVDEDEPEDAVDDEPEVDDEYDDEIDDAAPVDEDEPEDDIAPDDPDYDAICEDEAEDDIADEPADDDYSEDDIASDDSEDVIVADDSEDDIASDDDADAITDEPADSDGTAAVITEDDSPKPTVIPAVKNFGGLAEYFGLTMHDLSPLDVVYYDKDGGYSGFYVTENTRYDFVRSFFGSLSGAKHDYGMSFDIEVPCVHMDITDIPASEIMPGADADEWVDYTVCISLTIYHTGVIRVESIVWYGEEGKYPYYSYDWLFMADKDECDAFFAELERMQ